MTWTTAMEKVAAASIKYGRDGGLVWMADLLLTEVNQAENERRQAVPDPELNVPKRIVQAAWEIELWAKQNGLEQFKVGGVQNRVD